MIILFDHGTPRGIAQALRGHTVKEARAQGFEGGGKDAGLKPGAT